MIVYCPTCENECSEVATKCPRCGHLLAASGKRVGKITLAVIVIVGGMGLGTAWVWNAPASPSADSRASVAEQEAVLEKYLDKKAERKERIIRLANQRVEGGFSPEVAEDAVQFAMKVSEYSKEKEAGLKDIYADIAVAGLFEMNMPVEEMAVLAMMLQQESIYLDLTTRDLSRRPQNKK